MVCLTNCGAIGVIDDGYDRAHDVGVIGWRTMQCPAQVESCIASSKRAVRVQRIATIGDQGVEERL